MITTRSPKIADMDTWIVMGSDTLSFIAVKKGTKPLFKESGRHHYMEPVESKEVIILKDSVTYSNFVRFFELQDLPDYHGIKMGTNEPVDLTEKKSNA